jgi:hypothetical protein
LFRPRYNRVDPHPLRFSEPRIGSPKEYVTKRRPLELRVAKIRPLELGAAEIRPLEQRTPEIRPPPGAARR